MLSLVVILFSYCVVLINGHGYLFEPIARSSAWLIDPSFKQCCTYEGHMEMFCGGVGHQWNSNGGKCGICGEPYDRAIKVFEKGGAKYTGKIVKTYVQGQQIDVQVKLSANHQGYFEFRLCSLDATPDSDATQECLDRHLLTIVNMNTTKYRDVARHGSEMITIRLQLPVDISCQHCVFQWKYTTGNNWGRDPMTNKSGPGLGRENETFMGCSDITVSAVASTTTRPPMVVIPSSTTATTVCVATATTAATVVTTTTTAKATTTTTLPQKHVATPSSKRWSLLLKNVLRPLLTTIATTTVGVSTSSTTTVTVTASTTATAESVDLSAWSGLLVAYERGDHVIYNGMKYRCVTSHRSYAGAEPSPLTWALWRKIE